MGLSFSLLPDEAESFKVILLKSFIAILVLSAVWTVSTKFKRFLEGRSELRKGKERRSQRDQKLKQSLNYLKELKADSAKKELIINSSAVELMDMLNKGRTTSTELLLIFF